MSQRLKELQEMINKLDAQGKYQELVQPMAEAVALTREEFGPVSAEYAAILNAWGGVRRDIGNYTEAEAIFREAVQSIEGVVGREHPDYATTLNNMAGLYRLMGRHGEAEKLYQETLQVYGATLGDEHFLTISALNNLGLLYQDMGRLEEAELLHRQCLTLLGRAGDNAVAFGTTLNNLSTVCKRLGKNDEAGRLLAEAKEIYEQELGPAHPLYICAVNNLAGHFFTIGDFAQALDYFTACLPLCENTFGRVSRNYISLVQNLEIVCRRAGQPEQADAYGAQAKELAGQLRG